MSQDDADRKAHYDKGSRDGKPRGDRPKDRRDGRGRGDRQNGRPRGDRPRGRSGDRPRDRDSGAKGHGHHAGDRGDRRSGGRGDRRGGDRRQGSGRRPQARRERPAEGDQQERRLTIPKDPEKILFKGIDCEVNGKRDLALTLYLHGASKLSGGCENNAARMIREAGDYSTMRGRVAKDDPKDVLVAFDYLCATIDEGYDTSFLSAEAEAGNPLAIYELIRLDRLDGDSPCIDAFASHMDEDERMVREGLKRLARRKDSVKASGHLEEMDRRAKERQRIAPAFIKAMKGDASARQRLDELGGQFREARFLAGYIDAGDKESYLRAGMDDYCGTIVSMSKEMGISGTPFGKFLAAKKAQGQGEDWIPQMIAAAVAGSDDAVAELMPVQKRGDVRKGLSSVYLARGDVKGLVGCYDGEDSSDLERYCGLDATKTIEVARLMGASRGIDWLKRGYEKGIEECRGELVEMARSGSAGGKQLVYALHDVGADLEAAKLYMSMYGDKALPAVRWLAKVCQDEQAKEFLRQRFEEMGDTATFESIFVDDGYNDRGRRPSKGGKRGAPRRR